MKDSNKSLLWGALIGSVVGSVTALLLAPKTGRELRKDITDGARQVSDKGQELAFKVGEQSSHLVSKVKETADVVIKDIQSWRCSSDGKEIRISATITDTDKVEEHAQGQARSEEIQSQEQVQSLAPEAVSEERETGNVVQLPVADESKAEN
ncbi:YtxH domain-containing protein [Paenibacillus silvae]|jgi:gas vesicle protein|uniref:YtxH domain-containing protein n=1 Tax=Paenibacillus TaxID=44249 RepID=UPI001C10D9E2|nr:MULTISPECIES: YtxH domain-containing protein [Paenibacillus]MBU5350713.1 YtxH domain-containing protein [Paenibacillus barcinonensis]MDM5278672.1 YtxH domain-containing protein [Paenibacillus silvae]